jgi:hypothetical protein
MTQRTRQTRVSSKPKSAEISSAVVEDFSLHVDTPLSLEDLAKLPLNSRQVVLNTCVTALSIGDRDLEVSGSNAQEVLEVSKGLAGFLLTAGQDAFMRPAKVRRKRSDPRKKVFVVHGHDEGSREAVARFLEKIGFEAIILAEQTNDGRAIIEKFEDHAEEAVYAVVLATPDDIGGPKSGPAAPRPRQNVIFELGFFVGRLGRGRVCLLRKGDLEGFSDFQGVVYTDLDSQGAWKVRLAREMEQTGLSLDMAKAARA